MATFTRSDDLQGAEFVDTDLRGARFVRADLSGVVMRGGRAWTAPTSTRRGSPTGAASCASTASTWSPSSRPSSTAASPGAPSGAPEIRTACGRPGPTLERAWAATLDAGRDDAGRHGRRLGRRRVVVRADAAAPRPGHRHVAAPGGPGDRAAVPPDRAGGRRRRGRRPGHVDLHDGPAVVRRGARGPGGPRRDGARLPRRRHPGGAGRAAREPVGTRRTRRPPCPACT